MPWDLDDLEHDEYAAEIPPEVWARLHGPPDDEPPPEGLWEPLPLSSCEASMNMEFQQFMPLSRLSMPVCFSSPSLAIEDHVQPLRLLAFGDSLTAGYSKGGFEFEPYGRTLSITLEKLNNRRTEAWVCGLTGHSAAQMVEELDADHVYDGKYFKGKGLCHILETYGPFDVVLIMAGTNDLGNDAPDVIVENIKHLHAECHQRGVRTVALTVPPSSTFGFYDSKSAGEVNCALQKWTQEISSESQVRFVDVEDLVPILKSPRGLSFWDSDALHFSAEGSRTLGFCLAHLLHADLTTQEI